MRIVMRTILNDKKNRAKKVSICEEEDVKHHKMQNLKYFESFLTKKFICDKSVTVSNISRVP